jgi:ABC-type Fe3+ transport system permease subunit
MSLQFAAGLTAFVGLCLTAGWIAGFRNRSYVGWLGLAFLALAGFLLALGKAQAAREFGGDSSPFGTIATVLLVLGIALFLVALVAAVRETSRRLQELRESHEAAAEGLLELLRASAESGEGEPPAGPQEREKPAEDEGP